MLKFSLFGIPIDIQPMFFLLVLLLGYGRLSQPLTLVVWAVVVFVSVLGHELGHALAFRQFGHHPRITLYGMGGLTHGSAGVQTSLGQDLIVALAGPGVGLVLGGLVWVITTQVTLPDQSIVGTLVSDLLWVNIGWSVFNLLPMLPLDGGHVLLTITRAVTGGKTAQASMIASGISLGLAIALGVAALVLRQLWIVILAAWFGFSNFQSLANARRGKQVVEGLGDAQRALQEGRDADAIHAANQADRTLKDPGARAAAQLIKAVALMRTRRPADALNTFDEMATLISGVSPPGQQQPGQHALEVLTSESAGRAFPDDAGALLEQALFSQNRFDDALRASEALYARHNQPTHAYNAACSLARLGRIDDGIEWLRLAVAGGFRDREKLQTDPDLASLRSDPRFQELVR